MLFLSNEIIFREEESRWRRSFCSILIESLVNSSSGVSTFGSDFKALNAGRCLEKLLVMQLECNFTSIVLKLKLFKQIQYL